MIESSSASDDKTEGAKPSGMQIHINCIYILSQDDVMCIGFWSGEICTAYCNTFVFGKICVSF